ncbi:MAG TPA: prepilin-type N-terminal cleavage/methylation domain-containing protein [Candidatus Saccharimonadales bacterium]|nr:prepilin-type N-terminal cleavage/methylation domain-containing protein [Candidatus Saccharimonadales bacterium]
MKIQVYQVRQVIKSIKQFGFKNFTDFTTLRASRTSQQAGFTLIELLISITMISVLALVVSEFYSQRLVSYARSYSQILLQTNTKQAVETMMRDIKSAQNVEPNNSLPDDNSPGAPADPYSWASTPGSPGVPAVLVLAVPALDSGGNLLYSDALHNAVYVNNLVYYIDSAGILYKRVIANPIAGNAAVTTCPPALASPACPADAKVVEDVADLQIAYYLDGNTATTTPSDATMVEATLKQTRISFGRSYNSTLTSRARLRN